VRPLALALALFMAPSPTSVAAQQRSAAEIMDLLMWGREPVGGPFSLTDQTGRLRTNGDFQGKLMLIYFGFTYCPDICPTDLQSIGLALDELGQAADKVQPLFITVDPERDTAEHLKEYLPLFHPRLIGLTGDTSAIRAAAEAYKVYYEKVSDKQGENYTVDHTALIYLMGADGSYVGFFPPGTSPERIAETLRKQLQHP
jgi:protein SCO1